MKDKAHELSSTWEDQDPINQNDEFYMRVALLEAKKAFEKNEVPVGAVLVSSDGKILNKSHNLKEALNSSLGHAETLCIHRASRKIGAWRLLNCTLYVTLEPCVMCAGALINARIQKVIFAAKDPKAGAMGSLYDIHKDLRLNHQIEVRAGLLADESAALLRTFFKSRRNEKKQKLLNSCD